MHVPDVVPPVMSGSFVVIGPADGDLRLLAGLDDDELPHHPVVLVLQDVAVVHVRVVRVGVLAEGDEQPDRLEGGYVDGVLPAGDLRRGRAARVAR